LIHWTGRGLISVIDAEIAEVRDRSVWHIDEIVPNGTRFFDDGCPMWSFCILVTE
jgi:hypothetical protein